MPLYRNDFSLFSADQCPRQSTHMYVFRSGRDRPGCGFSWSNACRSVGALNLEIRISQSTVNNFVMHVEHPMTIGHSNCQWNTTKDGNVCFSLMYHRNSSVHGDPMVTFDSCIFSDMKILTGSVNSKFQNCSFVNSSLSGERSKLMHLVQSEWTNITRTNAIFASSVQEFKLDQCKFTDSVGLHLQSVPSASISNCSFIGNRNNQEGTSNRGALTSINSHLVINDVTFEHGVGTEGGAINVKASNIGQGSVCSLQGENLYFYNNSANDWRSHLHNIIMRHALEQFTLYVQ